VVYCERSAKQAQLHDITPESNYVFIHSDGRCVWNPRYEQSVIHCAIDANLFPFDEQNCSLVFASWILSRDNIRIDPKPGFEKQTHFVESANWQFLGEYVIIIN